MKLKIDINARTSGALQEVVPAVHCVVTDQLLALAFPPHPCAVSPSVESGVTTLMPSEVRAMVLSSWEITKKIYNDVRPED